MTIDESRSEIDKIDSDILRLFEKRMKISDSIARVKMKDGLPVLNTGREQAILDKAKNSVTPEYSQYAVSLCSYIMELSRSRQHDILTAEGGIKFKFNSEISLARAEIASPRVAVQGVPGSYAGIAAAKMYGGCELEFVDSWDKVMCCLQDGSADYGVLPVENSTAGSVIDVYDLLLKYKYNIVKALQLPVSHCLLGVRGAVLADIKDVYTHPHAFPQCKPFFDKHCGLNKIPYCNTAIAAQTVAQMGDRTKAAIASKECAHIYGLDVLAESIQQTDDNCTRFISISKKLELHGEANKISLIFSLPHVTGSLCRTLSRFSMCGHNLTKIESRPDPKTPFEYYFYVDFIGSISSAQTANMLGALRDELPFFYFLGNYDEN